VRPLGSDVCVPPWSTPGIVQGIVSRVGIELCTCVGQFGSNKVDGQVSSEQVIYSSWREECAIYLRVVVGTFGSSAWLKALLVCRVRRSWGQQGWNPAKTHFMGRMRAEGWSSAARGPLDVFRMLVGGD